MIIPLYKNVPLEELAEEWELDIPENEWVEAVIPWFDGSNQIHEARRYDFIYNDFIMRRKVSCYIYYNEENSRILGIDSVVLDVETGDKYDFVETPFYSIYGWLDRNF